MRITVYKSLDEKIQKDKILEYDLNDTKKFKILWKSYEDESGTYAYPKGSFGLLEKYKRDILLHDELPDLISHLELKDEADKFSEWLLKNTREKEESYYFLNNIKAAKSLFEAIYDFFKEEDILIKIGK